MAALFAATYPERTLALMLYNAFARLPGRSMEHQQMVAAHRERWGRREMIEQTWREQAPSLADDPSFQRGIKLAMLAHTGECERAEGKLVGIAVHIGARIAATAGPGETLVSSTVKDLVAGSGIQFQARGTQPLKGIPNAWHLYKVVA
jgi:class 3 adenylate cyclase